MNIKVHEIINSARDRAIIDEHFDKKNSARKSIRYSSFFECFKKEPVVNYYKRSYKDHPNYKSKADAFSTSNFSTFLRNKTRSLDYGLTNILPQLKLIDYSKAKNGVSRDDLKAVPLISIDCLKVGKEDKKKEYLKLLMSSERRIRKSIDDNLKRCYNQIQRNEVVVERKYNKLHNIVKCFQDYELYSGKA